MAEVSACLFRKGTRNNEATQFKKGQKSWNTGKKGWIAGGRSKETRFKEGHLSGAAALKLQPIGTERTNKDGLLVRKMRDDGPRKERWKLVHVLAWEEAHGPVPAGHIVVFRSKDKSDVSLGNLELITRAENMARNTFRRWGPEIAGLYQLKGAVMRQINKRAKREQ